VGDSRKFEAEAATAAAAAAVVAGTLGEIEMAAGGGW
jgi:hypothetical protein